MSTTAFNRYSIFLLVLVFTLPQAQAQTLVIRDPVIEKMVKEISAEGWGYERWQS